MALLPLKSAMQLRCLRGARLLVAGFALVGCAAWGAAPHPNDPAMTLAADKYGYQPVPARYLVSGATMFTLHFVDATHLLFTFHTHGLLDRLPDAAPEDNDRRITAVLIELPSGRELARTVWRTRDQDQYLWPMTHGRFLLRIRSKLTMIDPLRGFADGDAFLEHPFLELKRRIGYIAVSPGGDLLSIETLPPHMPTATAAAADEPVVGEPDTPARTAVEVRFYRVTFEDDPGKARVTVHVAGSIFTRTMISIPATSEGFLDLTQDGNNGYLFDFQTHAGKRLELSGFQTSCLPRPYMISRSEFVAFGCDRTSPDRVALSEFNFRAQQTWLQVLNGQHIAPIIAAAPAAGRFVLSRLLIGGTYVDLENLLPDELTAQELTVFQNHDGRLLLKTQASPIQRAGQNFDLSPDGMWFTTMQSTQHVKDGETYQTSRIVVFHLAELTGADQKELKLAAESVPEKNDAAVRLVSANAAKVLDEPRLTVQTGSTTVAPVQDAAGPDAANAGDAAPRKPPSLYSADHPKDGDHPKDPDKPPPNP